MSIVLLCTLYCLIIFNRSKIWTDGAALSSDKGGYYLYLPAVFIYNDLATLSFYPDVNKKYNLTDPPVPYYGCYPQHNTGKVLNKYPVGIALMELPFFLAAHAFTQQTDIAVDGFSRYYQLSVLIGTVFWIAIAFFSLRALLRRHINNDTVIAFTILTLGSGTNLYYYTAFEGGMSHPFSFACFAIALNFYDLFCDGKKKFLVFAAVFFGLIVIIRPSNVIFCVIFVLLWRIANLTDFRKRISSFIKERNYVIVSVLIFSGILFIQCAYWKYVTGSWIHYSYEEEGFRFLKPQVWKGLFSYRKGWFVYTPVAIVALCGLIPVYQHRRSYFWAPLLYLIVNIYVVFSWHQWYYGGGFGSRPLIESLVALALPLAYLFKKSAGFRKIPKVLFCSMVFCFITLNIWQTYQYSMGIIPWDNNNRAYYWRVFFKMEHDEQDKKLLEPGN